MIKSLKINNYTLFQNVSIEFENGFSVSRVEMDKMQDRSHRYCFVANSLAEDIEIKINI